MSRDNLQIRVDNARRPNEPPVEASSAFNGERFEAGPEMTPRGRWLTRIVYAVLVVWIVAVHVWAVREMLAG